MRAKQKVVYGVILAAGVVSAVIFARNTGLFRSRAPRRQGPPPGPRAMSFQCGRCKHEFVGYEVERVPGTDPRVRQFRYRRPGDKDWVPGTDKAKVTRIRSVVCPKCKADMRSLIFTGDDLAMP